MRLLVSALLAASVSLSAFAPAQACISACSGGGGGGSSTSTGGGSSSSGDSGDAGSSKIDGYTGNDTSAMGAFLDSLKFDATSSHVTLTSALDKLTDLYEAYGDFHRAEDATYDLRSGSAEIVSRLLNLFDGTRAVEAELDSLEQQITERWGTAALDGFSRYHYR